MLPGLSRKATFYALSVTVWCMKPSEASEKLFSHTPRPVKALEELARKERRESARREFKKNAQQKNWDKTVGPL